MQFSHRAVLPVVLVTAVSAAVMANRFAATVSYNGKPMSSDVLMSKGKAYIPVADVAKALNVTVVKTANGFDLVAAGGANAVKGVTGGMGDELFNGKFRFRVVSVGRSKDYHPKFKKEDYSLVPRNSGNEIVTVVCRLKNGTTGTKPIDITGGKNTALTDLEEHSYSCFIDSRTDMVSRMPNVIPGAAIDFALSFEVPEGTPLKDLIYTVEDVTSAGSPDFRVSLKGG